MKSLVAARFLPSTAVPSAAVLTAAMMAAVMLGAPGASANPDITDPYCTGGQTPLFGQCKMQTTDPDLDTTGLDPEVATGVNPEMFPAI